MPTTFPSFEEIVEGFSTSHTYTLDERVYEMFISAFGDTNPLHVDTEYARSHGYADKVMHGAILNGFLSHFIGVHFPGRNALLHSVKIGYSAPNHLGDKIRIDATVVQKVSALRVIVLEFGFANITQERLVARAKAQVGMVS